MNNALHHTCVFPDWTSQLQFKQSTSRGPLPKTAMWQRMQIIALLNESSISGGSTSTDAELPKSVSTYELRYSPLVRSFMFVLTDG